MLGIKTRPRPNSIFYLKKSKRVSVSWIWAVHGPRAVRLGIIAPPNDVRKRAIIKELLLSRSDDVSHELDRLSEEGFYVEQWWIEE
ncbi:MAG: hypothetical protein BAJATHORv1_20590 [Candidatus Thorarchaeota archaeon]|nr:MAG: hypothetical protein BAJATHORv1_20590 [Candidatus Thorarchaeota archaeon]